MKTILRPTLSYSLKEAIGEHTVVTFNVGPRGEVHVLLAMNSLDYRTQDDGLATFAKIVPDTQQCYRVLVLRRGEIELDLVIQDVPFNIHLVQPLGNDLLLACSRSEYRGRDDFDRNARVYARDGTFLRDFLLGDGLATIQTTNRGEIWTSYFDEGVFGNYGWHDPVGAAGLVAWNGLGEKVYEYDAVGPVGTIVDCYALNVASAEDVWCCYYMNFPLVHLHKKRIAATWDAPVSGSHAFAVAGNHVLFAGGYKKRDMFQLVRLAPNGQSLLVGDVDIIGDDDTPIKSASAIGRGAVLYVLDDAVLYEIDLNDALPTQRGG